jgi:hypothetical protein
MIASRRLSAVRALLPLIFLLGLSAPVAALERGPFTLEVLVDGVPLAEYAARSKTYVEALEGHEYSIRLSNRTSHRIAVALAVDGLNSIDAKSSSARDASKWILGPHQTITLDGWQTSSRTARRFFFTTEGKSYGAWLGKTRNLGVISAAVFREKRRRPAPIQQPPSHQKNTPLEREEGDAGEGAAPSAPAETDRQSGTEQGVGAKAGESKRLAAPEPAPSDDLAATGIGQQLDHRVRRVRFEAEPSPAAVMEIRYEYRGALVRLGVLPRPYAHRESPLERRERAHGFEDTGFAPDPYR